MAAMMMTNTNTASPQSHRRRRRFGFWTAAGAGVGGGAATGGAGLACARSKPQLAQKPAAILPSIHLGGHRHHRLMVNRGYLTGRQLSTFAVPSDQAVDKFGRVFAVVARSARNGARSARKVASWRGNYKRNRA